MFLSTNRDDDLIEMPFVTEFTGCPFADCIGKGPPEFLRPSTRALMRNDNATGCKQVFDHPQTERKSKVQMR